MSATTAQPTSATTAQPTQIGAPLIVSDTTLIQTYESPDGFRVVLVGELHKTPFSGTISLENFINGLNPIALITEHGPHDGSLDDDIRNSGHKPMFDRLRSQGRIEHGGYTNQVRHIEHNNTILVLPAIYNANFSATDVQSYKNEYHRRQNFWFINQGHELHELRRTSWGSGVVDTLNNRYFQEIKRTMNSASNLDDLQAAVSVHRDLLTTMHLAHVCTLRRGHGGTVVVLRGHNHVPSLGKLLTSIGFRSIPNFVLHDSRVPLAAGKNSTTVARAVAHSAHRIEQIHARVAAAAAAANQSGVGRSRGRRRRTSSRRTSSRRTSSRRTSSRRTPRRDPTTGRFI